MKAKRTPPERVVFFLEPTLKMELVEKPDFLYVFILKRIFFKLQWCRIKFLNKKLVYIKSRFTSYLYLLNSQNN